jgi:hypothetical protein
MAMATVTPATATAIRAMAMAIRGALTPLDIFPAHEPAPTRGHDITVDVDNAITVVAGGENGWIARYQPNGE